VISSGKATLVELQTVLSVADMHTILEVLAIDAHNWRRANERDESRCRM
jgi:hypothetical protein